MSPDEDGVRAQPWQRGPAAGGAAARWPWQAHWRSFRPRVLACTSPAGIGLSLLREVAEGGGDSFGVTGPGVALRGQLGKRCRPLLCPGHELAALEDAPPPGETQALPTSSGGRSSSPSRGRSRRRGSTRP